MPFFEAITSLQCLSDGFFLCAAFLDILNKGKKKEKTVDIRIVGRTSITI